MKLPPQSDSYLTSAGRTCPLGASDNHRPQDGAKATRRVPHMHTLTLLTASLKRGIRMMDQDHRPALCTIKETSESFLEIREPRTVRRLCTRLVSETLVLVLSGRDPLSLSRNEQITTPCFPTPKLSSRDQASAAVCSRDPGISLWPPELLY